MADDEMQTPDDDAAEPEMTSDDASEAQLPADDVAGDAAADDADGGAPEADAGDAAPAAAETSGEPISQDEIDQLFAEQGDDTPAAPAAAQPAGGGATELEGAVAELLGDAMPALADFATKARETLSLGVESAMGQTAAVAGASVATSEYSAIEQEFAANPHLGFELRLSLSETESHLVALLIPLPDAGALFSIETSPDQMADEEFAQSQLDTAATTMRELLDLVSLTLFTEGLSAAEVTLSDQRVDQVEFTMGIVADVAQGATPLRVELVLALPGGIPVTLTLVVPSSLAIRLAELIGESEAVASIEAPEPISIDSARVAEEPLAAAVGAGVGAGAPEGSLAAEFPPQDNPRAANTIGGSSNVDVHPVRFPPLPDMQPPVATHRGLDLIMDVQMRVAVELGRSTMTVEDVLSLGPGSVVELNKLAGEAVDILVNERLIARGEVVVVDENFGVRVTEIVSPRRRAHAMGA